MNSFLKNKNRKVAFFTLLAFVIPGIYVLATLKLSSINFWYDPSRDLLTAWDSLTKPTLLGPPTGIPGLHYGPYWIWLLGVGLIFSKNPIVVTIITATIPYLIIFPLLWFRLKKYFDQTSLLIGWLLFIFGNGLMYATQLWNPYPSPLLTIAMLVFLLTTNLSKVTKTSFISMLLSGLFLGLVVNFHISYGITLVLGIALFLLIDTLIAVISKQKKPVIVNRLQLIGVLCIGTLLAFLPTLLFETRHSFIQIKTLVMTFLKYGDVVTAKGLSKGDIFNQFLKSIGTILHVPDLFAGLVVILILGVIFYKFKTNKLADYDKDIRIFLLAMLMLLSSAFVYFTAKNPIWEYHFIGVDMAFLLLITYAASKIPVFKKLLLLWTVIIVGVSFYQIMANANGEKPYFEQQQSAVKIISQDASGSDYSVYSYSRSIYMYDYSYLFRWLANKNMPYDPALIKRGETVYLIFPSKQNAYIEDFIHNRAPQKNYLITKKWYTGEITVVKNVKR